MIFSVPVFVEERAHGRDRPPLFIARPLFVPDLVQRGEKLSRALARLAHDLQQRLQELGEKPRHDALADWTFHPLLDDATLELRIELASGSHRRRFFLAGYPALGRMLWFTPALPDFCFEVRPGQALDERATAALTRHLRDLEAAGAVNLDDFALVGQARLTVLEIHLHPAPRVKKANQPARALLCGGEEKEDGDKELRRTGRPLHALYPDDLNRAVGRDREVAELARLLAAADRRPILLVGPRQVGKTAILHELVWQMCARKKERFGGGRELWLVSPMRLVSGMSGLGEWENRVLAILEHVRASDHVLYFDDLPGLFAAGVTNASDLNVAQVLQPALEKHSVRVVAEITPEAWGVLRERHRAFADLFHVLPIPEPPEAETLRVLISVARHLEEEHRCPFDLDIIPTAYELHRRYAGGAAFPGKAAGFLRRLAVRSAGGRVTREQALHEFREQSGLQVAILDDGRTLARSEIVAALGRGVVGQPQVLEALADVLVALKARLNDPRRPLGSLLLLGPTGVGKTQSAKALAEFLFGSPDRLLRFDMNEYVEPASAARLTGTPGDPEGLLTSAVRRQPFSVVLFDEFEKAAPEVFDLLLAVLDEGRLTDSLGRLADFTQTVLLFTSNLGVREARARLGFGATTDDDDAVFVRAAEEFFRPEFFNRLDRIVPFRALDRASLEGIARGLLQQVFARDGLQRRRALLTVTPAAMNRLVELGDHPQLGARALKRVVEQEVAQPLAEKLAATAPGPPLIASLDVTDGQFVLHLRELAPGPRTAFWPEVATRPRSPAAQSAWTKRVLEAGADALDRLEAELEAGAPSGRIELGAMTLEHARYFYGREQVGKVEHCLRLAERAGDAPRPAAKPTNLPHARPKKIVVRQFYSGNPRFGRLRDAVDLSLALSDLTETEPVEAPDSPLTALLRELALLEAMAAQPADDRPALLVFRAAVEGDGGEMAQLARHYMDCLEQIWGDAATTLLEPSTGGENPVPHRPGEPHGHGRIQACYLRGPNLRRLIPEGAHSIIAQRAHGGIGLIVMQLISISNEAEARARAREFAASIDTLDLNTIGPVLHLIDEDRLITDLRTGLAVPASASPEEFRALLLSTLPLPAEVQTILS